MKRHSDYGKWDDIRHRKLPILQKCVYDYLWDKCSRAGFFTVGDPDADAFKIGCGPDQFRGALIELCKAKPSPAGDPHRGFVKVNNVIWISHFVYHDQQGFGVSANKAHKPIVSDLLAYTQFHGEPEMQKVLHEISDEVYEAFGLRRPSMIPVPIQSSKPVQASLDDKKATDGGFDFNEIVNEFVKITNRSVTLNPIIEKAIRDRVRDGVTKEQMFKVFRFKNNEWKDDAKMKNNITMELLLSEKFHQYLNQANNDDNTSSGIYRRPDKKN